MNPVSVSVLRRACGRGEAAWAGERIDSAVARAGQEPLTAPPPCPVGVRWPGCPAVVSRRCPPPPPAMGDNTVSRT
eukprot:6805501-Pyramimonas_sp.AAC.1